MHFYKKAIIQNRAEWDKVYGTTVGGDGFPCSPPALPCLVLEARNPAARQHEFEDKAYIFITGEDIMRLLGAEAYERVMNGKPRN